MTFRGISMAALAVSCILDVATAAPSIGQTNAPTAAASVSTYRLYVKEQAETLVGLTRALAKAIRQGELNDAQMLYPSAHRFLARLAPISGSFGDLNESMDARADDYAGQETDPAFSGFHRIEYGLFAVGSTKGLADYADRLEKDVQALRDRLASLDLTSVALADETARRLEDVANNHLAGRDERYAKTDLWDLEANIDGARQVVSLLQSEPKNTEKLAPTAAQFAKIDALIANHAAGCGFESYDNVSQDERAALKAQITALAETLSTLRRMPATD